MISRQHLTASFAVLLFSAFFLPSVAVFAGLAVAPFYTIVLCVLFFEGWRKNAIIVPFNATLFFMVLLVLWALLSSIWAINSDRALAEWATTFIVVLLSAITIGVLHHLRRTQLEIITIALMIALPLMLLFIVIELESYGALYGFFREHLFGKSVLYYNPEAYNRGACFLAIMFWVLAMSLSKKIRSQQGNTILFLVGVGGATLLGLSFLESLSAKLAFIGGIATLILVLLLPNLGVRLLQVAILALAIAIPIIAPKLNPNDYVNKFLPPSALHRVFIWNFAGTKAAEHPWLGYGFYNARDVPGGKEMIELPNRSTPIGWIKLPNHPHNAMLQLWLELGYVGLALYVLAALCALNWVIKEIQAPLQRALMAAMMSTYLGISLLAFNMWQEWWIATGLFAFMLMRLYVDGFIEHAPLQRGGKTLL